MSIGAKRIIVLVACAVSHFMFSTRSCAQDPEVLANTPAGSRGTTYAFIVGVAHYPHIKPALDYADADALLIRRFVESAGGGLVKPENLKVLRNDSAKCSDIISAMNAWLKNRPYKKGDRLFVYLAGHGDAIDSIDNEFYFLGYNCNLGNDGAKDNYQTGGAVDLRWLQDRLKPIADKGVDVILIMDACRTNEMAEAQTGVFDPVSNTEIVMLSTKAGGRSQEAKEFGGGHGLFTWFLIDGLAGEAAKGRKGPISLLDLEGYVSKNVISVNPKQKPVFLIRPSRSRTDSLFDVDTSFYRSWAAEKTLLATQGLTAFNGRSSDRGVEGPAAGGSRLDSLYRQFKRYLSEYRFQLAYGEFRAMKWTYPDSAQTLDAEEKMMAELLNTCQIYINLYLQGKDQGFYNVKSNRSDLGTNGKEFSVAQISPNVILQATSALGQLADSYNGDSTASDIRKLLLSKYNFTRALMAYKYSSPSKFDPQQRIQQTGYGYRDDGLYFCRLAIDAQPKASSLYNCKGILELSQNRDTSSAKLDFLKAISLNPRWVVPYNSLGNIYKSSKNYHTAQQYYYSALRLDTASQITNYYIGDLYLEQNRYDSAIYYFKKTLGFYPDFIAASYKLGYMYLDSLISGEVDKSDMGDSSRKYFINVSEIDPTVNVYPELSFLFRRRGDLAMAEKYARKARELTWLSPFAGEGEGYLAAGDIGRAELSFRKSLVINPDAPDAYTRLMDIFKKKELPDSVIRYFAMSQRHDSSYSDLRAFGDYLLYGTRSAKYIPQAIEAYKASVALSKKQEITDQDCVLMSIADGYSQLKDKKNGLKFIERALRSDCFDKSKAVYLQSTLEFKALKPRYKNKML